MDKKEYRVLMKYCFLKGKNKLQAKTWLSAKFPDTTSGTSTIKDWYAKFRHGEMSTEDDSLSEIEQHPLWQFCSEKPHPTPQTAETSSRKIHSVLASTFTATPPS
ncbi:hypothetical protein GWI33_022468 [Rhynchophorus ferrugineus]|uniref:Mos1 transposase HTH domain-containing protein n=1 Tax=Rhynchophorus ferrugineus TaxID=354439 RepID=A0A834M4G6_RHYFE|nr:hypothetical protein GWI33_022468 [Rhynchophorus ferrugineus]